MHKVHKLSALVHLVHGVGAPEGLCGCTRVPPNKRNAAGQLAQEWALEDVDESWAALKRIANDPDHPQQLAALKIKFAYAHGKPPQHVTQEIEHLMGRPVSDEEHEAALRAIRGEVGTANAHVLPAGSDMLAALEAVRRGSCWCGVGIGNPMMRGHSKACGQARAAVAKARGEAEP